MDAVVSAKLDTAAATAITQQGRADTKAGTLLTLSSILVAGLSAMASKMPTAAWVPAIAAAVAVVISASLAILVIAPSLGGNAKGGFIHWATLTDDAELLAELAEDNRAAHLRTMARITLRKMKLVRHSAIAGLVGLVFTAVAALLTATA